MSQIASPPTSICFNPACSHPHNLFPAQTCASCQAQLSLQGRYRAIQVLGQGQTGRLLLVMDHRQQPALPYVLRQRLWVAPTRWDAVLESGGESGRNAVDLDPLRLKQITGHPQMARVLDEFMEDGYSFQVQEYIPGPNLAIAMSNRGLFTLLDVWALLRGLLPVLEYLHAQGVIHGDIKPENIIARGPFDHPTGYVLVDWGTAQAVRSPVSIGARLPTGSAEYAAPEQLAGKAGVASDLYSLGVTCLYLLTGMRPLDLLDGSSQTWVWRDYWVSDGNREHLELANFLDRLICLDLNQRFASAAAAIAALPRLGKSQRIAPPERVPAPWHCYAELQGHEGLLAGVNGVAISPQGEVVASASEDRTIRLWEAQTGQTLRVLKGHDAAVKTVLFHPQVPDVLVSGGCDGRKPLCEYRNLRVWDVGTGQLRQVMTGHQQAINALAWSGDGRVLASGSADKTIKLWEFSTGECLATLSAHRLAVNAVAFLPQSSILVSGGADACLQVWNWEDLELLQTLRHARTSVRAVAVSPRGEWCASAGQDRMIYLWDTRTWQLLQTLPGHGWLITGLAFSPDGAYLFSSSWDHTIKAWNLQTGQAEFVLTGHSDCVTGVAMLSERSLTIAATGNLLATCSRDKTLRLWRRSF